MPRYVHDVNTPNEESLDDNERIVTSRYEGDKHIVETEYVDEDPDDEEYVCEYCGQTFDSGSKLGGHVRWNH